MELTLMTPKQHKNADISSYRHLGRHHWKAFMSATGKFDPGKANYKPRLEMLAPGGTVKTFHDHKNETVTEVIYDDEYVFEYYYQRLIVTMGWADSGELDEPVLRLFYDKLTEYAHSKARNTSQEKIEKQARTMHEAFPEKSVEEWREFLLGVIAAPVQTSSGEEEATHTDETENSPSTEVESEQPDDIKLPECGSSEDIKEQAPRKRGRLRKVNPME